MRTFEGLGTGITVSDQTGGELGGEHYSMSASVHSHSWKEDKLTPRSQGIRPNPIRRQGRTCLLSEVDHSSLATSICRRRHRLPAEPGNTSRDNNLALHRRDITPRRDRLAESTLLKSILVSRLQQLQKGNDGEEGSCNVGVESAGHLLHLEVGEQVLADLGKGQAGVPLVGRAEDARVGDEEVDVPDVVGDLVYALLERLLVGYVADDGDDDAPLGVGCDGGGKDASAAAEDVNALCTVGGEGAGHHKADA